MKKIVLFSLLAAASALALACNGDDTTTGDGGPDGGGKDATPDVVNPTDGGGDAGNPPPTLKTQIDRMGRPAINTALNHVFDLSTSSKGTAKDAYNADKNVSTWQASYTAAFAASLAVLDSLDGVCGNQTGYANGYAALAGLTADDRLYVNTGSTTCTTYLAVEANALGILTNTDCGGRKLDYDVIDSTYSAVAIGQFSGVGDGVPAVAAKTNGTAFPYLAAPQ